MSMCVCVSSHLWSFGFVLSVEKLRQRSPLNFMDANKKSKEKEKYLQTEIQVENYH